MFDHPFSEEIDPNIQSKPHPAQLGAIPLILKTYEGGSGFTKHKESCIFQPLAVLVRGSVGQHYQEAISAPFHCFLQHVSLTLAACC